MTIAELQQTSLASGSRRVAPEDFFILLAHVTRKEKIFLLAHPEYSLNGLEETTMRDFLERRLKHEPVAYIIGHKEFYGNDFFVTKDTLIPRPETELLVEHILDHIHETASAPKDIIDIGSGSGNIIVTLSLLHAHEETSTRFFGIDISREALQVAKKNALLHKVENLITFLRGDLLTPYLPYKEDDREIIIAANLPYLARSIYDTTSPDVHDFEPIDALISEEAGLAHYYQLLRCIKKFFHAQNPIILFLEISPEQTATLTDFVLSLFPDTKIHIHKDLAQKDRVLEIHMC